ncbi:MAG: S41 family peptidase [Candidatus Korobacteraceae bacterium]
MIRAIFCHRVILSGVLSALLITASLAAEKKSADVMTSLQRDEALRMLKDVTDKVGKEYYDPTYHGLNLDTRSKEAEQRIRSAQSLSDAFGVIAWFLDALNDSHTFFIPPRRPFLVEDGWESSFVGDDCMITAVKTGSDAASKGMKPGDQLLAIEGFRPTRANWWKLDYAFHGLSPRSGMNVTIVSPGSQPRELTVMSSVRELPKNYDFTNGFDVWQVVRQSQTQQERFRPRAVEVNDVLIWKLPVFMISDEQIDAVLHKAANHKALIIDLRGNPGGAEENLAWLLGGVFDHEVKVGDRVERKASKPFTAKPRGHAFSGKLIVLVNSRSASAAELFARVVQLEKRGTVIGDRSAGAVMEAREFPFSQGAAFGTALPYGVEVTVADLKMTDGNSLEHHGVVPDEILLPSPEELAAGADPQLARALQLAGVPVSAGAAGQLFPIQWR